MAGRHRGHRHPEQWLGGRHRKPAVWGVVLAAAAILALPVSMLIYVYS